MNREMKLANALASAKNLMAPEGQQMINSHVGKSMQSEGSSLSDIERMYENAGNDSYGYSPSELEAPQYSESNISSSKLPKEILESMTTNQIDTSCMNPDRSVLDRVMPNLSKTPKKRPVNEQVRQTVSVQQQQNGAVDYTIIKAIVEEVVDRKLKEHEKKNLNESTLKGISLGKGKIRLIDNSGNIFQGNLEYKGNTKK